MIDTLTIVGKGSSTLLVYTFYFVFAVFPPSHFFLLGEGCWGGGGGASNASGYSLLRFKIPDHYFQFYIAHPFISW